MSELDMLEKMVGYDTEDYYRPNFKPTTESILGKRYSRVCPTCGLRDLRWERRKGANVLVDDLGIQHRCMNSERY